MYESLVVDLPRARSGRRQREGGLRLHRGSEVPQPRRSHRVSRRHPGAARARARRARTSIGSGTICTGTTGRWSWRKSGARSARSGGWRALRLRAATLEKQLSRSLDELRRTDEEFATLQSGAAEGLEEIRSVLERRHDPAGVLPGARAGTTCASSDATSSRSSPLGDAAEVRKRIALLQFQLSKFRLQPGYVSAFAEQLQAATEAHLRELYARAHRADPRSAEGVAPRRRAARHPARPAVSRALRRRALSHRSSSRSRTRRAPASTGCATASRRRRAAPR